MAQTETLHVPVLNGMRQDVSERIAPPGTLTLAENVRFNVQGEASSRPGTTGIDASLTPGVPYSEQLSNSGPEFLTAIPGGFVFGARGFAWRYDFAREAMHVAGSYSNAVPHGRFAVMAGEEEKYSIGTGFGSDHAPWPTSVAAGGGYIAICWSTGNGQQGITAQTGFDCFKIQVFTESGTLVTTIVNYDYRVGWVTYDNTVGALGSFVVVGQSTGGTQLAVALISLTATDATLGAFSNIATLNAATCCWAVCAWEGQGWAIVYQGGPVTGTIIKYTGSTPGLSTTFAMAAGTSPVSAYADASNLYVGWVDVGGVSVAHARVYSTALALTSGAPAVVVYTDTLGPVLSLTPPLFGTSITSGAAFCVVGRAVSISGSSTADTYTVASQLTASGSLTTQNAPVYNMFPVTSPFNNGMVWCRYRTPNSSGFGNNYVRNVLLDYQSNRTASGDAYWRYRYPRVALVGDAFADPAAGDYSSGIAFLHLSTPQRLPTNGHWLAGMPRLVRAEDVLGFGGWGLAIAEWLEFETEARRGAKHIGSGECFVPGAGCMVGIGGGGTRNYNSFGGEPNVSNPANGVDNGFFFEPNIDDGVQSNTAAGALTLTGTYYYRRVIEWIDGQGRRHRSRPSLARLVVMTGVNDTVTFTSQDDFSWLREGRVVVPSGVVAHYYRTSAGGSTFYRCSPPQGAPTATFSSLFVDTLGDSDLQNREILYTDGGVLGNDGPPSCRLVALAEDRLWVSGLWDKRLAQSSKIIVPGEPIQFSDSPAFQVVIPDDVTAIAAQDGAQVFFCRSSVYAVQGLGPTDQGQGDWGSPRVVTRSTGCINELSVLETGVGIFFQSRRGLELLPRGLGEPVFIGEPVSDELSDGQMIAAASVVSLNGSTSARFIVPIQGKAGGNRVLVYEMKTGAWSVDVYPLLTPFGSVNAICDTDNGAVLGLLQLQSNQGFLLESSAEVKDLSNVVTDAAEIASVLTWADVRPAGIAGQARFNDCVVGMDEDGFINVAAGGTVKLTATIDKAADVGATFDTSILDGLTYLKHFPAQVAGSGLQLRLDVSKAGWRCFGWTVGYDDMGGSRRTGSTEQA